MKYKVKIVLLLLPILLSGCGYYDTNEQSANYYYLNSDKNLSAIGRIALIELSNDSAFPLISADVTESLYQALQKKQVFGLSIIRQSSPAWRKMQLDMNSSFTLEELATMRNTLNCDAVLFGTVTGFEPFPHLTIGLRLKLVDLSDGQLLWALEQIWDTTDETTKKRIGNYYRQHSFWGSETLQEKLGTVSSLRLVKFVTYETAETLEPKK